MNDGQGKYGGLIKKARKPASQKTSEPDSQQVVKPENQQAAKPDKKMVNLCVRVPESQRRWWAAQAKLRGVTMTDVMVEALTNAFGLPDDQLTR